MAKITVAKPFRLNIGGQLSRFSAGVHTVEKDIAEHWFVKEHLAKDVPSEEQDSDEIVTKKVSGTRKKAQTKSAAKVESGEEQDSDETEEGQSA